MATRKFESGYSKLQKNYTNIATRKFESGYSKLQKKIRVELLLKHKKELWINL